MKEIINQILLPPETMGVNTLFEYVAEDAGKESAIVAELVAIFYGALPLALVTSVIISTILVVTQWPVLDHGLLSGWLASSYLVTVLRFAGYWRYRGSSCDEKTLPLKASMAFWGAVSSGLIWGSAGFLLFPPDNITHQVVLSFCLAGVAAGGVTTLSAQLPAALSFLMLSLLPLETHFLLAPHAFKLEMGLLVALFLALLLATSYRLNRTITETLSERYERRKAEKAAFHQAQYDELTGLPNRRLFRERLEQELARALRHGHQGALLFLDLDHFKRVNDSLGHQIGDRLLTSVAHRILRRLRKEDLAARLGGDEFVILLPEIEEKGDNALSSIQAYAADLQRILNQPHFVEGNDLNVSASIGVAMFPCDGLRTDDILRHADVAMYGAKDAGRNSIRFFLPCMQEAAHRRLDMERGLRRAIARREFSMFYQPIVDFGGRIIAAEALLRWHHPTRGLIPPGEFIGVAEESGLIFPLGEQILHMVCRDLGHIGQRHAIWLSVNVSPRQFRQPNFVDMVQSALSDGDVAPNRLHVEITETAAMESIEQTIKKMYALKSLGVGFAIDDFGTGYSSLAHIKRLPVDAIKIDRSFVSDLATDSNDATLVETILVMARHLGLDVIAEGVETREALDFLVARNCSSFQGFLFSRPATLENLLQMLDSNKPLEGVTAARANKVSTNLAGHGRGLRCVNCDNASVVQMLQSDGKRASRDCFPSHNITDLEKLKRTALSEW